MAAPTFVTASTGATDATGAWTATSSAPGAAGRILILHVLQDGTAASPTVTSITNAEDLSGTDNVLTYIGEFNVGSAVAGSQHLWIGRSLSTSAAVATGANAGGDDLYYRYYEFTDVNIGTSLEDVIENGDGDALITQAVGGTNRAIGQSSVTEDRAQQFTALSASISKAALSLRTSGTPTDDLSIELQTDAAGIPSGTVLASDSIPAASLTAAYVNYTFDLPSQLTIGGLYWIVVGRTGALDGTNFYQWDSTGTSVYAGGLSGLLSSGSWTTSATIDLVFIVYGIPSTSIATSATAADAIVTTLGVDRLAVNFGGITDDASGIALFAGMSGGTWAHFQSYETSTGTDGTIFFEDAAMAAAGTIDGGTDTIASLPWGTAGFALIGTTPAGPEPLARPINTEMQAVNRSNVY
jgi:hypothetical protein